MFFLSFSEARERCGVLHHLVSLSTFWLTLHGRMIFKQHSWSKQTVVFFPHMPRIHFSPPQAWKREFQSSHAPTVLGAEL